MALILGLFLTLPALSQVVVDRSLGHPRTSLTDPNRQIGPEFGKQVGPNLFHSFAQFDIPAGESATFTGPNSVHNVIARVTGDRPSLIQGPIFCTIPGANFFFINPAGITFADGGSIDTAGAIAVSTADRLHLGGGRGNVDARTPGRSVLTAAPPAAFGFLSRAPKPVLLVGNNFSGQGLTARTAQPISIVAGDVTITGGSQLQSFRGAINVVSVASPTTVTFDPTSTASAPIIAEPRGLRASPPALGTIRFDNAILDASFGGQVRIRAANLSLDNQSSIVADTDVFSGGHVDLAVAATLDIRANSFIRADTTGPARGADVTITAGRANFFGVPRGRETVRAAVTIDGNVPNTGTGDGGDISVRARAALSIDSPNEPNITGLTATAELGSTGRGGAVTVDAPRVRLTRGGEISSVTKGAADAGDIHVRADSLVVDGFGVGPIKTNPNGLKQSQVQGRAGTGALPGAKGGLVRIDARSVRLTNSGVISASTFGEGDGGDVDIRTGDLLASGADPIGFAGVFARSAPAAASPSAGFGTAGSININATGSVVLRDGGQISVYSQTTSARSITITAGRGVALSETRPNVTSAIDAAKLPGEPTNTRITTQALNGDSGDIRITTPGPITLFDSFITARAGQGRAGAAITLDPGSVALNRSIIDGRAITQDVSVQIAPAAALIRSTDSRILSANQDTPPNLDLSGALIDLPAPVLSRKVNFLEACGLRLTPDVSSFLINGRGAVPAEPGGFTPSR